MRSLAKLAVAGALASAAFVALPVTSASAAIVCNREGECWHVRGHYAYKPEFGLVVHPNRWRWGTSEHFTWREHEGRGYWRNGVWVTF
jgi:hypothetical protein